MTVARARKDPECRARLPKQATLPSSGDQCRSKDGHAGPRASKSGLWQPGDEESHGQEGTLAATAVMGTGGRWPALRDRGQTLVRRSHSRVQGIRSLPVPPAGSDIQHGSRWGRGERPQLQPSVPYLPHALSVPQHPAPSPTCPTSRPCPTSRACPQTAPHRCPRPMACPMSCPRPAIYLMPFPCGRMSARSGERGCPPPGDAKKRHTHPRGRGFSGKLLFFRTTFKEFAEKYGRDQRFRLVQKKKDQEHFFNQFILILKKRDKENRLRLRRMR